MKIVHFVESLDIGGLPNYVLQLAELFREDFDSVVIAHMGDTINKNLETDGFDIVRVGSAAELGMLAPDLIHVHLLSDPEFLQGLFTLGVPLIRSFHDYTSTCLRRGKRRWPGDRCQRPLGMSCAAFGCVIKPPKPGKLFELADLRGKIAERDLYRNFDALITGSNHMTGMLHKNGFAPERVYTIPYFSRFAEYADVPMAKELGAASARPLELLFSGQAVKGKGLEILVSALHGVRGNWRLTVFSEGVRLEHAKTLAAELGIAERIDFRGWVTQSALAEAYRRADLFVLPSIWDDPGPLVGIEAMSFGTPVVGFAVGGIPDYLIDRKTGFLVTDTTAAGLRRTLQFCVESPMMLPILGAAGQKRVALHHTPAIHKENISMVYNKVLKTGEKTY